MVMVVVVVVVVVTVMVMVVMVTVVVVMVTVVVVMVTVVEGSASSGRTRAAVRGSRSRSSPRVRNGPTGGYTTGICPPPPGCRRSA